MMIILPTEILPIEIFLNDRPLTYAVIQNIYKKKRHLNSLLNINTTNIYLYRSAVKSLEIFLPRKLLSLKL